MDDPSNKEDPPCDCGAYLEFEVRTRIGSWRRLTAVCHLPEGHAGNHRSKVGKSKEAPIQLSPPQNMWLEWEVDQRPVCSACEKRVMPKQFKDGVCLDCGGYCETCRGTGRKRELWLIPLDQCPPCPECGGSGKRPA